MDAFGKDEQWKRLITSFRASKRNKQTYSEKRPLNDVSNSGDMLTTTNKVEVDSNIESQRSTDILTPKEIIVKDMPTKSYTREPVVSSKR